VEDMDITGSLIVSGGYRVALHDIATPLSCKPLFSALPFSALPFSVLIDLLGKNLSIRITCIMNKMLCKLRVAENHHPKRKPS
jgi:hypothetical protein